MRKTNEGGNAYEHSLNHALEFFSKAGSLFEKRGSFYGNEESALSLFQKSWIVDKELTFRLLMWLRDCRGGAGNRSASKEIYKWLALNYPNWIECNIINLVNVGRFDDLRSLFGSELELVIAKFWADEIKSGNVLAAKWADRKDIPLRKVLRLNEAGLRKLLSNTRSSHIVEHKMCSKEWEAIEYEKVPSVAMARYTKAFGRNDSERFLDFKNAVKTGEKKIHASVLFPHDCVRTVMHGDSEIGEAQFDALPNYLEGVNERIIVVSDTSGSMDRQISGSVRAVHISQGMALYCSAKISSDNPFHKKFIGFCSEGKFKNWKDMTFSQAVRNRKIFDGAVGSTRIDIALDLLLETSKFFNLTNDQIPTTLLIVSDMQFHQGCRSAERSKHGYAYGYNENDTLSEVEIALKRWSDAGYNVPKIVYWNTAGYGGQQTTEFKKNVCLISGFSPSILRSIFTGEEITPVSVMLKAIEKYNINIPEGDK